jgi:hypothetical protein
MNGADRPDLIDLDAVHCTCLCNAVIAKIARKCPSGTQVRRISWETEGLGRSVTDFWPPQNRRRPATMRCLAFAVAGARILDLSIKP